MDGLGLLRPSVGMKRVYKWQYQTVSKGRHRQARMECHERDRLIEAVAKAAQGVYAALAGDRRRFDFVHDIQAARAVERDAAAALAKHRAKHNC
jgi:hypothetical protein